MRALKSSTALRTASGTAAAPGRFQLSVRPEFGQRQRELVTMQNDLKAARRNWRRKGGHGGGRSHQGRESPARRAA